VSGQLATSKKLGIAGDQRPNIPVGGYMARDKLAPGAHSQCAPYPRSKQDSQ